jgi:hypothetical protein
LIATYPFFDDVCVAVGRLLRLQGNVSTPDLRARLRAKWGDREIVQVAQRMCVYTLRAFGALTPDGRSISTAADPLPLPRSLSAWAVHALVLGRDAQAIDTMEIDVAPELFFTHLEFPSVNEYPLLERFAMAAGRSELVLADHL